MDNSSPDLIISKIRQDVESQKQGLLSACQKEVSKINQAAADEANNIRNTMAEELKKEEQELKNRIFSTLNLKKRKIELQEKHRFTEAAIAKIKEKSVKFRETADCRQIFLGLALEGLEVIDLESIVIIYSFLDEDIFKDDFVLDLKKGSRRDIEVSLVKGQFKDIGLIVQSKDGRLTYDNTFYARLRRAYDKIYMDIIAKSE